MARRASRRRHAEPKRRQRRTTGATPAARRPTVQLQTLHRESFEAIVGVWPLTVDEATPVAGGSHPRSLGIIAGGTIYALNGPARTHEHWADLQAIWADNPNIPGTKLPVCDLLGYAAARCWGSDAPPTPVAAAADSQKFAIHQGRA